MIAKELPRDDATRRGQRERRGAKEVTSPHQRWREVAEKIKEEQDPNSMIALVQQLITSFDEEHQASRRGSTAAHPSPKS
jgi:hypothetical protein